MTLNGLLVLAIKRSCSVNWRGVLTEALECKHSPETAVWSLAFDEPELNCGSAMESPDTLD